MKKVGHVTISVDYQTSVYTVYLEITLLGHLTYSNVYGTSTTSTTMGLLTKHIHMNQYDNVNQLHATYFVIFVILFSCPLKHAINFFVFHVIILIFRMHMYYSQ